MTIDNIEPFLLSPLLTRFLHLGPFFCFYPQPLIFLIFPGANPQPYTVVAHLYTPHTMSGVYNLFSPDPLQITVRIGGAAHPSKV